MQAAEIADRDEIPPFVRFERRAIEDKVRSKAFGRFVSKDVDFALITPAYSKDLHVKQADKWFIYEEKNARKGRTPRKHLDYWKKLYEAFVKGQELPLEGTPIKLWSAISPATIQNLIAVGILTVESLSTVNDEGIRRIGKNGDELRRKAKNWLEAAKDHGPLTLKVTDLETEDARNKIIIEDLMEKIRILKLQVEQYQQPGNTYFNEQVTNEINAEDILPEPEPAPRDFMRPDLKTVSRHGLVEQYEAKFGRAPHSKITDETLRKRLME